MKYFCEQCEKSYLEADLKSVPGASSIKLCPGCQSPCFPESNRSSKASKPTGSMIKGILFLGLLVGGAVLLFIGGKAILPEGGISGSISFNDTSKLPIEEKMRLADTYLEELRVEGNAFFKEMRNFKGEPQDYGKELEKYNKIMDRSSSRFNKLKLMCPSAANPNDPKVRRYLDWARRHESKNKHIMDSFNQQMNSLMTKAGFQKR